MIRKASFSIAVESLTDFLFTDEALAIFSNSLFRGEVLAGLWGGNALRWLSIRLWY